MPELKAPQTILLVEFVLRGYQKIKKWEGNTKKIKNGKKIPKNKKWKGN